jgi:hypothetical protein
MFCSVICQYNGYWVHPFSANLSLTCVLALYRQIWEGLSTMPAESFLVFCPFKQMQVKKISFQIKQLERMIQNSLWYLQKREYYMRRRDARNKMEIDISNACNRPIINAIFSDSVTRNYMLLKCSNKMSIWTTDVECVFRATNIIFNTVLKKIYSAGGGIYLCGLYRSIFWLFCVNQHRDSYIKISLLQAVEAPRVARGRGFHISYTNC